MSLAPASLVLRGAASLLSLAGASVTAVFAPGLGRVPVTRRADDRSLAIVIPAYCERDNIIATLENVAAALAPLGIPHEILVIDDGSTDDTAELVAAYARRHPAVTLLRNPRNMGFGWTYRRGVEAASMAHIVMVHGDNAWPAASLRELFGRIGDADVIIGYTRDMWHTRPWMRTVLSKTFTGTINVITRRRLKYYNGLQIHAAPVLKSMVIESSGHGFQAEVLVKSLRPDTTVVEVPMDLMERARGESKAFRVKNVIDVSRTLARLVALEWTRK